MNLNTTNIQCIILFCFCQVIVSGQVNIYKVYLKSKNKFIGQIVKEDDKSLTLKIADSSFVKVYENDIKKVRRINVSKIKNGLYWEENLHKQRYFFSSSAYTLQKGDISYRNVLGVYSGLEYGITNRLSMSGGLNLYSVFIDDMTSSVYNLSIKYGGWKLSDKMTTALSFNFSDVYDPYQYFDKSDKHLSLTGLLTLGDNDKHITLGLGAYRFKGNHYRFNFFTSTSVYDYIASTFATIRLNGALRLGSNFALISENWIVSNSNYSDFLSFGLRFMKYKFMAELALIYRTESVGNFNYSYSQGYPYLNISYQF